jgi:hypothetical protein
VDKLKALFNSCQHIETEALLLGYTTLHEEAHRMGRTFLEKGVTCFASYM